MRLARAFGGTPMPLQVIIQSSRLGFHQGMAWATADHSYTQQTSIRQPLRPQPATELGTGTEGITCAHAQQLHNPSPFPWP